MFIYKKQKHVYSLIDFFFFPQTKQDYLQTKQPTNLMHCNASPWDNKSSISNEENSSWKINILNKNTLNTQKKQYMYI